MLVAQLEPVAGSDGLVQYGAIGLFLLIAIGAIRVLFKREVDAHDRERARADRWETKYEELNQMIRDKHVLVLERATEAIQAGTRRRDRAE